MKGAGGGFEALLKVSAPASGPKQLKGLNLRKGSHSKPFAQLDPDSSSKGAVTGPAQGSLEPPHLQADAAVESSDQPSTTAEHSDTDAFDTLINGSRTLESVSMPTPAVDGSLEQDSADILMSNAERPGTLPEPPPEAHSIASERTQNRHAGHELVEADSQPLTEEAEAGAAASGNAQVSASYDPQLAAADTASQSNDSQADHDTASRLSSQAEPADATSSATSGVRSARAFWEALEDKPPQSPDDCTRPGQRKARKAAGSTLCSVVRDESLTNAAPSSGSHGGTLQPSVEDSNCSPLAEQSQCSEQPLCQSVIASAASAELPVSTMASSTPVDPDTSLAPSAGLDNNGAATPATASLVAPEGSSSGAETLQQDTDLWPGSHNGAESAGQHDVSDGQSPTDLLKEDPGDAGGATPAGSQISRESSQPLPPVHSSSGSDTQDPSAAVDSLPSNYATDSLFSKNSAPIIRADMAPELLPPPLLEAYTDSIPDISQKQSPAEGALPSASSSDVLGADTESTQVAERSEVGSVIDSEVTEDGLEDKPRPAGPSDDSSACLASIRRATPAGETSGATGERDVAWAQKLKHVFVLSNAGKPIFTLHGDGNELAGFMAVIHAMLSFAADRGDLLHSLRAGKHLVVFLVKGPLYLVAVSAQGEPASILRLQLETLYAQIVCILTTGFERMFAKNPRYDSRRLLGGTDAVLRGLIEGFDSDPSALLSAFPPLPIAPAVRHTCVVALQAAVKESGTLYGVLLVGNMVLALTQPRAHPFAPTDLLQLSNFVRTTSVGVAESFTPVCLPHFNPSAFLHAYIHYLDEEASLCLILLAGEQDAFYRLKDAGQALGKELSSRGCQQVVAKAATEHSGNGRILITELPVSAGGGSTGHTPLLHFLYKSPSRGQFIMPAFTGALTDEGFRKDVMASYGRVHAAMFAEPSAVQRIHYQQDDCCTIMAFVGSEYELFAAFDALAEKPRALEICQRLCAWVKASQATLFTPL